MSRFIDKLNVVCGAGPEPMGFRSEAAQPEKSKLQLVARLERNDSGLASSIDGADAGVVRVSSAAESKALEKLCQSDKVPWGAWAKGESLSRLPKTGCDFVIFSASDTPITVVPKREAVGQILEVDASLSEGMLRSLSDLAVDAVVFGGEAEALTWRHLMQFSRVASLVCKPLLVPVLSGVTGVELQAIWDVGVSGVIIAVSDEKAGSRFADLRKEIDKPTSESNRKRKKTLALLPRISPEPEEIVEEEEEEE